MKDLWTSLEEHTQAWRALDRQGLADAVWADYVTARFARTGDARAMQFLYPYLNRGDRGVRLEAIEVAARVFRGVGPSAIPALDYFTQSMDPFLKDRAVRVVGAALEGWAPQIVAEHLSSYLNHPNQFIQRQAITALSRAAFGSGDAAVLGEIKRLAPACKLPQGELDLAVARVFAGAPTEETYSMVARPEAAFGWRSTDPAVGILLHGAAQEWYDRACREFFEPRLHRQPMADDSFPSWPHFYQRSAIEGLCRAAASKGMEPLRRMLHIRNNACTLHALLANAPECFAGADVASNRAPLLELLGSGDVPAQRIAAACLGRLLADAEDPEAMAQLRGLAESARNRSVAAQAIGALGSVARSTCDDQLRALCLKLAGESETAAAAVEALGMIFQGSGRKDILADIRDRAEAYRHQRVPGKKHFRPLTKCFHAAGLVYQGTGSMEPVDFLLDALTLRRTRWCPYRWSAGRALVMIEFPASTTARALDQPWV